MKHAIFLPHGAFLLDLFFHMRIPKITRQNLTDQKNDYIDVSTIDGHLAQTRSQNEHIRVI